jgi:transposase
MQAVTTIGLDIAKSVFQIHGVDAAGNVIVRRQLKRRYVLPFFQRLPPCLIGIEACASSHHWSRELKALGHTVRLMPPAYVKPYVKRQKNDAADAEAICEAVTRANMRFVATKTLEQQSCLMLHRTRHLFIRQQTAVINAIRAHLAEYGIVAAVGRNGVEELLGVVADPSDKRVPEIARACLAALGAQLRMLKAQILEFDRMITAWHRSNETSKRLDAIPGVGPALATALVASVPDPKAFRSGRMLRVLIMEAQGELMELDRRIASCDRRIQELYRTSELCQRLGKIEGIGPVTATALVAAVGDQSCFKNGRQFAAWLGLVPKQQSSGGRNRLFGISKRGDRYLRTLIIHGARAALGKAAGKEDPRSRWLASLRQRRHPNVAAVALANKNARIAWAMLAGNISYEPARSVQAA